MGARISSTSILQRRVLVALCLAIAGSSSCLAATTTYTATALVSPNGMPLSGQAINNAGVIVGNVYRLNDRSDTFAYFPPDRYRHWEVRGSAQSAASAIDARGDVAGWSSVSSTGGGMVHRAYLRPAHGEFIDLFAGLDPRTSGEPTAVNDSLMVAGYYSADPDGPQRSFAWSKGMFVDLGTLGGADATALAINEAGVVVDRQLDLARHALARRRRRGHRRDQGQFERRPRNQ
jgi:probable HAF family extracellular repeat protein